MTRSQIPESIRQVRQGLLASYDADQRRYTALQDEVGQAKTRAAWEPEVQAFLDALQQQEHERSVGAFERLLTAFLQDVLPGPREVVLDLFTEKGSPGIDVFLRKGVGKPLEDAYTGTGGSVTNVLSAGLRMIALVRSGQRPFLVLDEPDCWLQPPVVPRFAEVIHQAAHDLGIQILMISHHDELLFDGILPHRLRLEKGTQGLQAHWGSVAPTWEPEQKGLRSILLENCQAHSHTFLPLAPGVTLLHGNNDIGKSAINTVLRATFYGESNDTIVAHGAAQARATYDFGPDHVLEWARHLKGKHKVVYTLFSAEGGRDAPLQKTAGARELPGWLAQFGIAPIEGLDVQLTRQKEPVFLLNLPASQRARALSVGGESGHVQAMMALDRQDIQEARAVVKRGEKSLELLHRRVRLLQTVSDRQDQWSALESAQEVLGAVRHRRDQARQLAHGWSAAQARVAQRQALRNTAAPLAPALSSSRPAAALLARRWQAAESALKLRAALRTQDAPVAPSAPRSATQQGLLARWRRAQAVCAALGGLTQPLPNAPQTPASPAKKALAERWKRGAASLQAFSALRQQPAPTAPVAANLAEVQGLARRWREKQNRQKAIAHEGMLISVAEAALATAQSEFSQCPLCQQAWHGFSHEEHA